MCLPYLKALRDFGGHGTEKVIQVSQGEKGKNLKIKIQVKVREVLDSEKYLGVNPTLLGYSLEHHSVCMPKKAASLEKEPLRYSTEYSHHRQRVGERVYSHQPHGEEKVNIFFTELGQSDYDTGRNK